MRLHARTLGAQHSARPTYLSLPGNGLIEEQVAGVRLVNAIVRRSGATEGLEAVSGQGWRGRGWVGLVTRSTPAPVATAAAAGWRTFLPGPAETLCEHRGTANETL